MQEKKQISIKKNYIMNVILTLSSILFPLITFPYVSRILLPVGTGKVSLATSVITYFNMIAQLGIPTYGIRICAQVRDNKEELTRTAQELLIINLIMCVLSYSVLGFVLIFVPRFTDDRALYVIISSTILLSAIGMEWLYKALEQYTYIAVRSIICKFIALIAMFLLIHQPGDTDIYGAISIFAASASNVMNFINVHKYIDLKPVGNYNFKRHMKPIMVFFAMSCATTLYTNLDTVMLGFMKTDTDAGYYNAAVKIKSLLLGIITSLSAVLLPRASYYVENKQMDEFKRISKKALNFVFIIACPLTIYFVLFASESIFFLSGSAYNASIIPMQILMPTLIFIGITNILGIQILVPLGREKTVLYSVIAGAITDLVLNAVLIPELASTGAAIGTLVAEAIVLAVQCVSLRDSISLLFGKIQYVKIVLALVIGSVACFWIKFMNIGYFLKLLISALIFFAVYATVLILSGEPFSKEIIVQIISKVKRTKCTHKK